MKGWCVYTSMKQCLQLVNHEQFPVQMTQDNKHNKWYEILDFQPKLLQRTPTKIHRERRRRRHQETTRKAQRTSPGAQLLASLSTAKATSLSQWPQTCAEAATKYYCDYNPEYLEPKAPSTHPPHPHTHTPNAFTGNQNRLACRFVFSWFTWNTPKHWNIFLET